MWGDWYSLTHTHQIDIIIITENKSLHPTHQTNKYAIRCKSQFEDEINTDWFDNQNQPSMKRMITEGKTRMWCEFLFIYIGYFRPTYAIFTLLNNHKWNAGWHQNHIRRIFVSANDWHEINYAKVKCSEKIFSICFCVHIVCFLRMWDT